MLNMKKLWITWAACSAGLFAAGFAVFPVPAVLGAYWFWHTVWHLLMFIAYWCAQHLQLLSSRVLHAAECRQLPA